MSKLQWPKEDRYYETGVDKVAIYVGSKSEAWSGITAVNESTSGGEPTKIYADDIVYGTVMSPEEITVSIECFAYPSLFSKCLGKAELGKGIFLNQQDRSAFGMTYRNLIRNANLPGVEHYKIHMIYKLVSSSSEEQNSTMNDSPEQKTYSFSATGLPVSVSEDCVSCETVLDSRLFDDAGIANALTMIERMLYGTDTSNPMIPSLEQITDTITYAETLTDALGRSILDSESNAITSRTFVGR